MHEPIHYVPVIEQRYAEIIQNLEQHPARNQWSRFDRQGLASNLMELIVSGPQAGPGATMIPIAVDLVRVLAQRIRNVAGFSPADVTKLLTSYVQPKEKSQ